MKQDIQQRKKHVDKVHKCLSVVRQCELLNLHRSGVYYQASQVSRLNLELMQLIDEKHLLHPWLGVPRMTQWLRKDKGYKVNHKRVARLYKFMGIQAVGPRPNTSKPVKGHTVYPYLLRNLSIERPNQVWAMDITYIPIQSGFFYLAAVIDLYSRYVTNWSLSNTMTASWCCAVLGQAIQSHGQPEIVNTDQGSQFTSEVFSDYVVKDRKAKLSMDGKGRAMDNIFIERLWRSVKYEHVYLFPASDGLQCYKGLENYFHYYNEERRHQSLDNETPLSIYQQNKIKAA